METNNPTALLVQNFILDDEQAEGQVTASLEEISSKGMFEELGRATYTAMLKRHSARLQASKVTLTAQQPHGRTH